MIIIYPVREISYNKAKSEITDYIKLVGGRKVYISEVAEELAIDMDLIESILQDMGMLASG
ncbi:MAG: hypothetical protein WC145_10660 [Aliarcobacter sp.]|jgi:hypothetical protein